MTPPMVGPTEWGADVYNLALPALAITLTLFWCTSRHAYERDCQARGGHVVTKMTGTYEDFVEFCVKDGKVLDE